MEMVIHYYEIPDYKDDFCIMMHKGAKILEIDKKKKNLIVLEDTTQPKEQRCFMKQFLNQKIENFEKRKYIGSILYNHFDGTDIAIFEILNVAKNY